MKSKYCVLNKNKMATLELYPDQQTHVQAMFDGHLYCDTFLDISATGTGKTFTAMYMAYFYDLAILPIVPTSMVKTWIKLINQYGIPFVPNAKGEPLVLSYNDLKGSVDKKTKDMKFKHNLFTHPGNEYVPTAHLKKICKDGVYLVFDECQTFKSSTTKTAHVVKSMMKVMRDSGASKAAFLSATPIDSKNQLGDLLRLMGIVTFNNMSKYNSVKTGLYEMGQYSMKLTAGTAIYILSAKMN